MAGYVTVHRLSLVQLQSEERKQRAHLKKIAEMQRRTGLDVKKPASFPHVNKNFNIQLKQKNKEIEKENQTKSKKLIDIMQSRASYPPSPPFHPTSPRRHRPSVSLSQNNTEFVERVSKVKGIYDSREWKRGYEEHKEHLRISKNNKLFTPRDIGINQHRAKAFSTTNSRRSTFTSSEMNFKYSSKFNA